MTKVDRRVQRTQAHLQHALIKLIGERQYDAITVQDVVDCVNVGRTTFYLHYDNKDDLFMSCHEAIAGEYVTGLLFPHSPTREELLSSNVPSDMIAALQHLRVVWTHLRSVIEGQNGALLLRQIRDRSAAAIEENLRVAFAEVPSKIPLNLLAHYLAGAQLTMIHWWLDMRRPQSAEALADTLHSLQRATLCDVFGLGE